MDVGPELVIVAGAAGAGKTTWIGQQLQGEQGLIQGDRQYGYLYLGSDQPIDTAYLNYRFPQLQVWPEADPRGVLAQMAPGGQLFVEVGFQVDPAHPPLGDLPGRRVVVVPPGQDPTLWRGWSQEQVVGASIAPPLQATLPQIWRTVLTGRVFDPASLDLVWTEIIQGAYGPVQRAKGLVELPDGRAFYIDFVQGLEGSAYGSLPIPPWLEGRPQRPSGLEIVGWDLDSAALIQSLLDSGLPDELLSQYQAHYRGLLDPEPVPGG